MKKIIALALTALMLISLVACNSDSASDLTNIGDYAAPSYTYVTDKGVFTFKESVGDTAIITGYTATTTAPHAVKIPATVGEANDRVVTVIGEEMFKESGAYVTSIEIPAGVTTIKAGAFHSCSALVEVKIPDSVASIGDLAFYGCSSLKEITLGEDSALTTIGNYAFADCTSLENFSFTKGLTSIGTAAFKNSAIKSVDLTGTSVKSIGAQAFAECANLNYDGCIILVDSITSIGKHAFSTDVDFINAPAGSYADKYLGASEEEATSAETTGAATEESSDASSEETSEEVTDGASTDEASGEETSEEATEATAE